VFWQTSNRVFRLDLVDTASPPFKSDLITV
jgi:hypothetical protein